MRDAPHGGFHGAPTAGEAGRPTAILRRPHGPAPARHNRPNPPTPGGAMLRHPAPPNARASGAVRQVRRRGFSHSPQGPQRARGSAKWRHNHDARPLGGVSAPERPGASRSGTEHNEPPRGRPSCPEAEPSSPEQPRRMEV